MNATHGCDVVRQIMGPVEAWVKSMVADLDRMESAELEQRVRREGIEQLSGVFATLAQSKIDRHPDQKPCSCGGRMHHGGRRERELLTSMGPVRLNGVYRRCRACGSCVHPVDLISRQWMSEPMRELVTTLGVSMASFAKARQACEQMLQVKLSTQSICRITESVGRALPAEPTPVRPVDAGGWVTGSCDGTSVNTREDDWRELKAYLFEHGEGSEQVQLSDAALEPSRSFFPRVRRGAITVQAGEADKIFFVADAAQWIAEGVRINLPDAIRIIDIYHAYQHVHAAAKGMFGEGTAKAATWARTWCEQLRLEGGREVWDRLRRTRYRYARGSPAREALEELLRYLHRHADALAYPRFIRQGWPISSGPMESLCKQLGLRLKGCGMRWSKANVTPMARLVCRWHNAQPLQTAA